MQSWWATWEALRKLSLAFPLPLPSPCYSSWPILSFCCTFIYDFHLLHLALFVNRQFSTTCFHFPSPLLYTLQLNPLVPVKTNSPQITTDNVIYFLINRSYMFVYSSKEKTHSSFLNCLTQWAFMQLVSTVSQWAHLCITAVNTDVKPRSWSSAA